MVTMAEGVPLPAARFFGFLVFAIPTWWAFSFYKFWKVRDSVIIKNRGIYSVGLHTFGITLCAIVQWLAKSFGIQCGSMMIINFIGFYMLSFFLIERIVLLIIHFNIAVKASKYAEAQMRLLDSKDDDHHEDAGEHDSLLKNKSKFNHSCFSWSKAIVVGLIVVMVIALIALISTPPWGAMLSTPASGILCTKNVNDRINLIALPLLSLVFLSLLECVRRLRHVRENYYIRQEMKYLGFVAIAIFSGIALTAAVPATKEVFLDTLLYFMVLPIIMIWASLYNIAKKAELLMREKQTSKSSRNLKSHASQLEMETSIHSSEPTTPASPSNVTRSSVKTPRNRGAMLMSVIQDDEKCEIFKKFMIQEFAVENLLFIKATLSFEKLDPTSEKAIKMAKAIYTEYIKADSKLCINIASSVRKSLDGVFQGDLQEVRSSVFDEAKTEILLLMQGDSFRRFIVTPEWKAFMSTRKEENEDMPAIKVSGV